MDADDKPRKAQYLGSFPVTLQNPADRARFIAQQLDHINRAEQQNPTNNGTPVNVRMMLCGIKVTSQTTQDTYMVHALRRVSFSTCLNELFSFAARDPGQPLDRQYCHVFKTKSAETLNSIIGGAFQSAYTLQRRHDSDETSCASGRQSRQSNISTMSTTTTAYANHTRPLATVDLNLQSSAECCEETFSDYQHDYEPEEQNRRGNQDYRSNSTTVRSKLSAHSDDSAISSLADDLERRVILEIERKHSESARNHRRDNDLSVSSSGGRFSLGGHHFGVGHGSNSRSNSRRRSVKSRREIEFGRDLSSVTNSGSVSIESSAANGVPAPKYGAESSGYSSINLTDSYASNHLVQSATEAAKPPSSKPSKATNFAALIKTNPVARKLRLLAPGDSYSDLDSRLRIAKWYHQGLPKDVAISVLSQAETGTFLVLPQTLLLRGIDHVHEYQIIRENKIGWYLKGSSRAFPHLLMLVAHYQSHKDILPLLLENAPVPK